MQRQSQERLHGCLLHEGLCLEARSVQTEDPFYRNTFVIGRGYLGEALASSQSSFNFDCQPRLSALGREGLRHLLAGTRSLRSLHLGNVELGGEIWADLVNSMLPELSLQELVLNRCRLSAAKPLGALLKACPQVAPLGFGRQQDYSENSFRGGRVAGNSWGV